MAILMRRYLYRTYSSLMVTDPVVILIILEREVYIAVVLLMVVYKNTSSWRVLAGMTIMQQA